MLVSAAIRIHLVDNFITKKKTFPSMAKKKHTQQNKKKCKKQHTHIGLEVGLAQVGTCAHLALSITCNFLPCD